MFIDETYLEGLTEKEKNKVRKVHDALCAPEDRIWNEICRGLVMKTDPEKYPALIFWFKQDRCYFEYDIETGNLWCERNLVWRVFERELGWGYYQIESFIKNKVEEHFKNKGVTPGGELEMELTPVEEHFKNKGVTPDTILIRSTNQVEEHFKNKGVTPARQWKNTRNSVEEHFKNKGVTPLDSAFLSSPPVEEHFKNKGVTPRQVIIGAEDKVEEHFKNK
jgi:hypothetical protein